MSKVIAVMDRPKDCQKCVFGVCKYSLPLTAHIKGYYCQLKGDGIVEKYDYDEKVHLQNCPLKEIPEQQTHYVTDNEFKRGAKTGYNACIKDILSNEVI